MCVYDTGEEYAYGRLGVPTPCHECETCRSRRCGGTKTFLDLIRWKRVRIANIVRGYVAELRLVTTLFAGRNPSNFRPPKNGVSMAQFNNNLLWRAPQSRGWEE